MNSKSYLSEKSELDALKALPLESSYRGVQLDRVAARLRTERSLFEGGHLRGDPARPWLSVVVTVERAPDAQLAATLASIALQSCPQVRCVLVPADPSVTEEMIKKFLAQKGLRPAITESRPSLDGENRTVIRKADYVCFLRHGDRLHPSAAAWLAIQAKATGRADVVAWGELQPAKEGGKLAWAQRNPAFHREALLHFPHLRNAFAVSSSLATAYPGDLVRELIRNSLHLFQIWLANRPGLEWSSHPEYFLIKAPEYATLTPEGAAARAFAEYADAYANVFATMKKEFVFARLPHDAPAPYKLTPVRRATSIAVIIPFRDKPELTLRAINSLAKQTFAGYLEIVLVDNQSSLASRARVMEGVEKFKDRFRIRIVDYNKPFNHSGQCNAGVKASLSEVVVFLNNDCEIISPTALEEMGAWAIQPGVASVGISIIDPGSGVAHAGMDARMAPTNYFDSTIEERSAPAITPFVRRTFGNTFALCAINRDVFDMLGGLDPIRFPNGYNDVDYACRSHQSGLHHISLGHLSATHAPGQSRARTDESPQKILVRTLYPSIVTQALETVTMDEVLPRMSGAGPAATNAAAGDMAGKAAAKSAQAAPSHLANGAGLAGANGVARVNGAGAAPAGKSPPAIIVRIAQSRFGRPLMNNRIVRGALRRVRRVIWPPAPHGK
jgi:GT2 family glycosyltransferase